MRNTTTINQSKYLVNILRLDPEYASLREKRISTAGKEYTIPIFTIADLIDIISNIVVEDNWEFVINQRTWFNGNKQQFQKVWDVGYRDKNNPIVVRHRTTSNPELIDALRDYIEKLIRCKEIPVLPDKRYYGQLIPGQEFIVDDPYHPLRGDKVIFKRYARTDRKNLLRCTCCRDKTEHEIHVDSLTLL